jgi:AcrR family transcriptional regulator
VRLRVKRRKERVMMEEQEVAAIPARRRLDPQVRRDLILDEAARIVAEEGVSTVSMERLGREAGISKALVYNYFPSRNARC